MKKTIKTIGTIATMGIIAIGSYYLGTTQAETVTEVQTVTEIKEVEKVMEVVPDGYIDTTTEDFYINYVDMRKVTDFTATENGLQIYLDDGSGYYWEKYTISDR